MKEITNKEELLNEVKNDKVIVDFYADWCGPCKMISPVLKEISEEKNVKLVKVNIDENMDLAAEHKIVSVPTIMLYENGENVKTVVGASNKDDMINKLGL